MSPAFAQPHKALKAGTHNQLVLKGGRGSAKSSYASIEGLLLLIKYSEIHGVVMRKVSNTLRTTVYAQYVWAITVLGLYDRFKCTVQPMEIMYKPTGQKIMFFGADDPGKIKSIKVPFGYIGYLHLEELDQFSGEDEVRNIEQSVLRGGPLAFEIKSFNPPKTKDNWANRYCLIDKPGQLIHHSTYKTTPEDWLGQRFLDDAEFLCGINPAAYEHEYLGIANGTGGMVFENVQSKNIPDELIKTFDRILNGVDWGYYPDPWAFVRCQYFASQRTLYIFDEAVENKRGNKETAKIIKGKGVAGNERVTCDSAEPKSVADYIEYGLRAQGAEKGPGSVDYSHKWLQSLNAIIIDPVRCPKTYHEFSSYEYERNKNGDVISGYPDKDNHAIDAVRYATETIWKRRETPQGRLLPDNAYQ
ncbi:PBSX family phage terminase large subunit [Ruminococcaceae bacterium OttesenSCG-928-I18]|nr:PBSX family phage terminase large subunit [Ruminococcaceae bacterium OttesenSCG-928-I18]